MYIRKKNPCSNVLVFKEGKLKSKIIDCIKSKKCFEEVSAEKDCFEVILKS